MNNTTENNAAAIKTVRDMVELSDITEVVESLIEAVGKQYWQRHNALSTEEYRTRGAQFEEAAAIGGLAVAQQKLSQVKAALAGARTARYK